MFDRFWKPSRICADARQSTSGGLERSNAKCFLARCKDIHVEDVSIVILRVGPIARKMNSARDGKFSGQAIKFTAKRAIPHDNQAGVRQSSTDHLEGTKEGVHTFVGHQIGDLTKYNRISGDLYFLSPSSFCSFGGAKALRIHSKINHLRDRQVGVASFQKSLHGMAREDDPASQVNAVKEDVTPGICRMQVADQGNALPVRNVVSHLTGTRRVRVKQLDLFPADERSHLSRHPDPLCEVELKSVGIHHDVGKTKKSCFDSFDSRGLCHRGLITNQEGLNLLFVKAAKNGKENIFTPPDPILADMQKKNFDEGLPGKPQLLAYGMQNTPSPTRNPNLIVSPHLRYAGRLPD